LATMAELAALWIAEMRSPSDDEPIGLKVVEMNFTAPAAQQWAFIEAAVELAHEEELGAIAAGPFEHLLGTHGDDYIGLVEERCGADPKFARMTTGAWQYRMSDEVWERVQAIQRAAGGEQAEQSDDSGGDRSPVR
jgi:hypothetical protein